MDKSGERLDVSGQGWEVRRGVAGVNPVLGPIAGGAAPVGAELIGSHYVARRWTLTSRSSRPFIHLLCLLPGNFVWKVYLPEGALALQATIAGIR